MARLSNQTILREMKPLLVLYPEAGHNGASLEILAEQWADLLADEDVSEDEFCWAIRRAKKRCKFFPKPADIMEGVGEYRHNPPPTVDAAHRLPQESAVCLSPEEIERNKARLEILTLQAANKISPQDAARRMELLFPKYHLTAAQDAAQKTTAEEAATRMAKLGHPAFTGTYM